MRKIIACAALLTLTGCGMIGGSSPKTQYYALNTVTASATASGGSHAAALAHPVTVSAVHIPPSLDRRAMVLHTGANKVDISETDRWTGPLGSMARRVLSEDLAARLPKSTVIMPDAPAPDDTTQIVVTISRFGPEASGQVALKANWSLLGGESGKPTLRRDVAFEERPSGNGGDAVAAAMSRLLGRLADRMVAGLGAR